MLLACCFGGKVRKRVGKVLKGRLVQISDRAGRHQTGKIADGIRNFLRDGVCVKDQPAFRIRLMQQPTDQQRFVRILRVDKSELGFRAGIADGLLRQRCLQSLNDDLGILPDGMCHKHIMQRLPDAVRRLVYHHTKSIHGIHLLMAAYSAAI